MIANEREYQISQEEAEKFEHALSLPDTPILDVHPRIQQAIREGAESLLADLRGQMSEYEARRGSERDVVELDSLRDLPEALIRARKQAGLTQKSLALRLGLKEQQIQRYEATGYKGASLERIQAVADALGVRIQERVLLPVRR